jgi:hypothetical protein
VAKSRHNTTKRGTQKQRARLHFDWLKVNHYRVWCSFHLPSALEAHDGVWDNFTFQD